MSSEQEVDLLDQYFFNLGSDIYRLRFLTGFDRSASTIRLENTALFSKMGELFVSYIEV
jgi:hypothetical protein